MKAPQIEILLFDVGNVLVHVQLEKTNKILFQNLPTQTFQEALFKKIHPYFDAFERNHIDPDVFFKKTKELLELQHLSDQTLLHAWNECLTQVVDGAEQVIQVAKEKLPLYALSNTNKVHFDFFTKEHKLFRHFKKIYTSFEFGLRKPEPEIYQKTFLDLKNNHPTLSPEKVLFIDDLKDNIHSAQNFGFTSELMLPEKNYLEKLLKKYFIIN